MTIKIFSVAVRSDNSVYSIDGLSYKGKLWLVPSWLENQEKEISWPERIIRFDNLQHQDKGHDNFDYIINNSIPKDVLDGKTEEGFEIIHEPPLFLPCRGEGHVH